MTDQPSQSGGGIRGSIDLLVRHSFTGTKLLLAGFIFLIFSMFSYPSDAANGPLFSHTATTGAVVTVSAIVYILTRRRISTHITNPLPVTGNQAGIVVLLGILVLIALNDIVVLYSYRTIPMATSVAFLTLTILCFSTATLLFYQATEVSE